jgi:hypothetical protein
MTPELLRAEIQWRTQGPTPARYPVGPALRRALDWILRALSTSAMRRWG